MFSTTEPRTPAELLIYGFIRGYYTATGKIPRHYTISADLRFDNERTKQHIRDLKRKKWLVVNKGFPGYDLPDRKAKLVKIYTPLSLETKCFYWTSA